MDSKDPVDTDPPTFDDGRARGSRPLDILCTQFRALETRGLTVEQVREVVIHLTGYVGTPSNGDLFQASEAAIAAHIDDVDGRS